MYGTVIKVVKITIIRGLDNLELCCLADICGVFYGNCKISLDIVCMVADTRSVGRWCPANVEAKMRQESYSRLWDGYETDKAAMQARNLRARELRANGHVVHCWTLPNQTRPYSGLGQPDGRSCQVYMINCEWTAEEVASLTDES